MRRGGDGALGVIIGLGATHLRYMRPGQALARNTPVACENHLPFYEEFQMTDLDQPSNTDRVRQRARTRLSGDRVCLHRLPAT